MDSGMVCKWWIDRVNGGSGECVPTVHRRPVHKRFKRELDVAFFALGLLTVSAPATADIFNMQVLGWVADANNQKSIFSGKRFLRVGQGLIDGSPDNPAFMRGFPSPHSVHKSRNTSSGMPTLDASRQDWPVCMGMNKEICQ